MTTEPTFDSIGLRRPNPIRPGWYRDPDPAYSDRYERYWDGGGWRPPGERRERAGIRRAWWQLDAWYWLTCVTPFILAVLVPVARIAWPRHDQDAEVDTLLLRHDVIVTGWLFVAAVWAGVLVGAVLFWRARRAGSAAAKAWHRVGLILALVAAGLGLLFTVSTDSLVPPPPRYPPGGVIIGP